MKPRIGARDVNCGDRVCLVFTVLWGKQTKKKHKTWEGDGTLEVTDCSAVLKIVEVMYTNENKRPASETVIATPQRVPKRPRRTSLLSAKHEKLKMPPPSHQHQVF
uniref:DUF2439 domain-containing protein n=1 Tax=Timema poppense TaxID=170557 RepID=A0A7R9DAS4_TIMPO|nr:unnamed protein product [Timema poppensis]